MIEKLKLKPADDVKENTDIIITAGQFRKVIDKINEIIDHLPQEKVPYQLAFGEKCLKCKKNLCTCPERQADGSWKGEPTKEVPDILKDVDLYFCLGRIDAGSTLKEKADILREIIQEISALWGKIT